MKRIITLVLSLIMVLCATINLWGCSGHVCKYSWTVVYDSTCEKEGVLEGICSGCGDKTYVDLEKKEHDYDTDNICKYCGEEKGKFYVDSSSTLGWTIDSVKEKINAYGGNNLFVDYYGFSIKDIYTYNGNLILGFGNFVISAGNVYTDYDNEDINLNIIKYLGCESYILYVIYTNGLRVSIGYINQNLNKESSIMVKSVLLNENNDLMVVFNDNHIEKVGKISTSKLDMVDEFLVYEKISSEQGYAVVGSDKNKIEQVEITSTHKGLPITRISKEAFYNCDNLKKVFINEGLKYISANAFGECENLEIITIPKSIESINENFADCNKLKIFYAGTAVEWQSVRTPKLLDNSKVYYYSQTYLKGGWRYVNDTPTLW